MSINTLSISAEDVRLRLFKYKTEKIDDMVIITERQYELINKVLEGKKIEEIAQELGVKRNTVIQHFHGIKKRLMPYVFEDRLIASLIALGLNDNHLWKEKEEKKSLPRKI